MGVTLHKKLDDILGKLNNDSIGEFDLSVVGQKNDVSSINVTGLKPNKKYIAILHSFANAGSTTAVQYCTLSTATTGCTYSKICECHGTNAAVVVYLLTTNNSDITLKNNTNTVTFTIIG